MAASTYKIVLANGQTLSVYQAASQAINSSPTCTFQGAASSATVTTDFSVNSDTYIKDIVVTSALTAGGIEVYNVSRSKRSDMGVGDLESYLTTNTTRKPPAIGFRAGTVYRLLQTVAGNA